MVKFQLSGNKMDARNLATIFAPSILRVDHDKLHETLAENEHQVIIVETMISNVEEIFKVCLWSSYESRLLAYTPTIEKKFVKYSALSDSKRTPVQDLYKA